MPLDEKDRELLEKAYTKAAFAARQFSKQYGSIYSKEATFYDERAKEFDANATSGKALQVNKAMLDEALYIAEQESLNSGNIDDAKKYYDTRVKLWS